MRLESTQLPFPVADTDQISFSYVGSSLVMRARAGDDDCKVVFHGTEAFRWQSADPVLLPGESEDGAYEIIDSAWLDLHRSQHALSPDEQYRHLKINFNAEGELQVICYGVERIA